MQDGLDDSGESTAVAAVVGNGHFAHVHTPPTVEVAPQLNTGQRLGLEWHAALVAWDAEAHARYKHWGRSLAACVLQPRVW